MSRKITRLPLNREARSGSEEYCQTRFYLSQLLIDYALVGSYHRFLRHGEPYPFVNPASLKPGSVVTSKEHDLQNSALVMLADGGLPKKIRKNFRCRSSNRVSKKNILAVAPNLPGMENYMAANKEVVDPGFPALFKLLLPLDYALLIQNPPDDEGYQSGFMLSNFHVRIERLTDTSLRSLGVYLNYLERRLYERGEAFVDVLERKFFEYFNFYHNAAGRKTAAATAAQVFSEKSLAATVFTASQQDRRLTLLTTNPKNMDLRIEQYILLKLDADEVSELKLWSKKNGFHFTRDFLIAHHPSHGVAILRARYEHTQAGRPSPDGEIKEKLNIREKWVRLTEEAIIPVNNPAESDGIGYSSAYRRSLQDDV